MTTEEFRKQSKPKVGKKGTHHTIAFIRKMNYITSGDVSLYHYISRLVSYLGRTSR